MGKTHNRSELSLYGETYIAKYKDKLFEFYEKGRKESSKKMNTAMMREQFKKEYLNIFSLSGEIEIKKYIRYYSVKPKTVNFEIKNRRKLMTAIP